MRQRSRVRHSKRVRSPAAPQPPPGYSYTRESDERPHRLKTLHEEQPTLDCEGLARLYQERHGRPLARSTVAAALRRAGVSLGAAKRHEVAERPARLVELLRTMRDPTRYKLAEAYEKRWGVALPAGSVYLALASRGIRLVEPQQKLDRDEVAARPERVFELAEEHPKLTHDQLGKLYEKKHGLRLSAHLVAAALHACDVYRYRLADPDELAERLERLRLLAAEYPDHDASGLAAEYARLYDVKLHPGTVQQALNALGIYRRGPVDPAEVAARPKRLRALAKKYPDKFYEELAAEYQTLYGTVLSTDTVEGTLRNLGIFRERPVDKGELAERAQRLAALQQKHPSLPAGKLAELYHQRYGISLQVQDVRKALRGMIPPRQQHVGRREREEREDYILTLHRARPELTNIELAERYQKKYRRHITPIIVTNILNRHGIYRSHQPTAEERRARLERLQALAAEFPRLNKKELVEKYNRRYGENLDAHSVRKTMRRAGVVTTRPTAP